MDVFFINGCSSNSSEEIKSSDYSSVFYMFLEMSCGSGRFCVQTSRFKHPQEKHSLYVNHTLQEKKLITFLKKIVFSLKKRCISLKISAEDSNKYILFAHIAPATHSLQSVYAPAFVFPINCL